MRRKTLGSALLVALLTFAIGSGVWYWYTMWPSRFEQRTPLYVPGEAPYPVAADHTLAIPAGCASTPSPTVGSTITFDGHGRSLPMLALSVDADGAPATPPNNEGFTVAWFNQGPMVGSRRGNVILTAHTFRYGGALGNELNRGLLHTGDIIRISDASGSTVCYEFTRALKINVADYDPKSSILYDPTGNPQIVLVVCADYPLTSGEPAARMLYFARLISKA